MATARPTFDPVDTSFDASANAVRDGNKDDVESPSLSNKSALARYEISNAWVTAGPHQQPTSQPSQQSTTTTTSPHKDNTKVLLVEWTEDPTTRSIAADWTISWPGKHTVLPAREETNPNEAEPINRLYFLLGAGVPIPTAITLQKGPTITWKTNPLPAIFSPELGATARQAGKKGVLHTIWAKKRLQVLQQEIEHELRHNVEGIGLEMATAEKSWIEENFGVVARPAGAANSPASPRSPGGSGSGRLAEKLKGLGLDTTGPLGLNGRRDKDREFGPPKGSYANPLSPESDDVAVGSFGSFAGIKGVGLSPPQGQGGRVVASRRTPGEMAGGMVSLDASLAAAADGAFAAQQQQQQARAKVLEEETEDDLFALPMSPHSPEMGRGGAFAGLK